MWGSVQLNKEVDKFKSYSPTRRYGIMAIALLIVAYLLWNFFFKTGELSNQVFSTLPPAVSGPKVPGPVVGVKKVPKDRVKKKFPDAPITEDEEWVDTVDVPPAPEGATVLTKIDTKTGEVTNVVKAKDAPWFAFEDTNTVGAGYEVGTQGAKIPVYYRRGLLRVKDVHLLGEVGGKVALTPTEKSEAHGALLMEFRW